MRGISCYFIKTWLFFLFIQFAFLFLPFVSSAFADYKYCIAQDELSNFRSRLYSAAKALPHKIEDRLKKQRLASISLAIVHDQDVIFCDVFGFADIEKKLQATKETIYPIASVTKVFTAAMLMQLCEKNIVRLETPIKELVSEYQVKSPYPGKQDTTLRQLASHTSGLPQDAPPNFWCNYSGFGWLVTGGEADLIWFAPIKDILSSLKLIELEYPPGIYSHYSNLGIQLLGIGLERAAEEPFIDYIESHIVKPLGMKNTGFMLDELSRSKIAVGHVCSGPRSPILPAPFWEPGCAVYSGGLNSTSEDMAKFISSLFQEGSKSEDNILSPASLCQMRTPNSIRYPGKFDSYGIGWGLVRIEGFDAIEHNGALLGHSTHISAIPELKLGVIIFSNSRNALFTPDACKDLARDIYKDILTEASHEARKVSFDPKSVDLNRYEGTYALPGGIAEMELTARDGRLFMSITQDPEFNEPFIPLNLYEFCFESDPGRNPMLLFYTDPDGNITNAKFLSYKFNKK